MYINAETMELYDSQQAIRNAFPNTSFPVEISNEILQSFSIYPVVDTVPVYNNLIEDIVNDVPVLQDGVWKQVWKIVPKYKTEDEKNQILARQIDFLKQLKNDEINAGRLTANTASFTHQGKVIDCDELSVKDINTTHGIVLLTGRLPDAWPGYWKTADNERLPITTIQEWGEFYMSMFNVGLMNFAHSEQLKYQLSQVTYQGDFEAAVAAINAIKW